MHEAEQQLDNGRLARTRWPDQQQGLAGCHAKAEAVDYGRAVWRPGVAHILERDGHAPGTLVLDALALDALALGVDRPWRSWGRRWGSIKRIGCRRRDQPVLIRGGKSPQRGKELDGQQQGKDRDGCRASAIGITPRQQDQSRRRCTVKCHG